MNKTPVLTDPAFHFSEKRSALVIGVNDSPGSAAGPLLFASDDARDMAKILQKNCGFTPITPPLLEEKASSGDVRRSLDRLVENRHEDDFLLFYFSGHGIPCKLPDGSEDIYLGTSDFSDQELRSSDNAQERHISLKLLRDMLYQRCKAGRVLLILDCCFAGNISGHGPDYSKDLILRRASAFLNAPFQSRTEEVNGLRWSLAATTYNQPGQENDGHGPMTRWLLLALSGAPEADEAIDNQGRVTFERVNSYLYSVMPDDAPHSYSGTSAGLKCILAYHQRRTPNLVNLRPTPYFPYEPDPHFRPRQGEFESLDPLLAGTSPVRLGMTGMGGVGKSSLARELAHRHRVRRFNDGIFWAQIFNDEQPDPAINPLIASLATLAKESSYLKPVHDSTLSSAEDQVRHLMRFLAREPHILLILDNINDPSTLLTSLSNLAGGSLQCSFIYTTRRNIEIEGIHFHKVHPFQHETDQLHVLLQDIHPHVLRQALAGTNDNEEVKAASSICQRVGGLPQALKLLNTQLRQHPLLTLLALDQDLQRYGMVNSVYDGKDSYTSLYQTFLSNWQQVQQEEAQTMFLLATFFLETNAIPLWLLALAMGWEEEDYDLHSPLTNRRNDLHSLCLIEDISKDEIQVHPLLREFGQKRSLEEVILRQAAERILFAFEDLDSLERRASEKGFWGCLEQLRLARIYLTAFNLKMEERLLLIERRLNLEMFFVGTGGLWPKILPDLFYQQMYNYLLEEGQPLPAHLVPNKVWIRQMMRVGSDDKSLLQRVFSEHSRNITCVAVAPDNSSVMTGSEDTTVCLFESSSGKLLRTLSGHSAPITCAAYSPDSSCLVTGSQDGSIRLWNVSNGEFLRECKWQQRLVNCVAFSQDGLLIATGSDDVIGLWERNTSKLLAAFSLHLKQVITDPIKLMDLQISIKKNEHASFAKVAFAFDTTHLAMIAGKALIIWNIVNHTIVFYNESFHFLNALAFRPGSAHEVVVADLIYKNGYSIVSGIVYSVDFQEQKNPHIERFMTLPDDPEVFITDPIHDILFLDKPKSSHFLTCSREGIVQYWDINRRKLLHTLEGHIEKFICAAFSPDGLTLWTSSENRTAMLWGNILTQIFQPDNLERFVHRCEIIQFLDNGITLSVLYSDGTIRIKNLQNSQETIVPFDKDTIESKRYGIFSPDRTKVATYNRRSNIGLVHNVMTHRDLYILEGHTGLINQIVFASDSRFLLTASCDKTARLWHAETGECLQTFRGHNDILFAVAFSSDNKMLLTGSRDGTARLWKRREHNDDYGSMPLPANGEHIHAVAFSPDSLWAFAGSSEGNIYIWDTSSGRLLSKLASRFMALIVMILPSPNGRYLLVLDALNQMYIWSSIESFPFRLIGAYTTLKKMRAVCWQDNQHILLADDGLNKGFPRIYRLQLEGVDD